MCSNFRPASIDSFRAGVLADIRETNFSFKAEVFPNEIAPIIRMELNADGDRDEPIWTPAQFGLVPPWVKPGEIKKFGRMAYNSRSETSSQKNTFRGAWSRHQFCLVPSLHFMNRTMKQESRFAGVSKWLTTNPFLSAVCGSATATAQIILSHFRC